MSHFWTLARGMLAQRGPLAAALAAAVVSAGSLGVGIVSMGPVLQALIGDGRTLPSLAREFNDASPVDIPAAFIDRLPSDTFTAAAAVLAAICLLTALGAAANFAHMYLSLTVVERTIARIRRRLFAAVIHAPLGELVRGGASESVSRVVNDPQALGAGFTALLSKGVAQVTKGLAAFAAAVVINWQLTAVTLLVVPVMATVIRKLGKAIRRASRRALERQAGLYAAAIEIVQGLRVVRVFGTERREAARFHRENKAVLANLLRVRTARALSSPLMETMAIVVVAGLALIAVKAVEDNEIDPHEMILTIAALGVAGASLRPLTGLINDIQQSTAAAERIDRLLATEPESGRDPRLPNLPPLRDRIAFDGVTFTYPGADEPALRGVSLEIPRGATVALVGPNGSGKTTLLSLVPRLFDPDHGGGRVTIDGRDLREVRVRSLRRKIAVVTQETVLFRGTIAENIAYGVRGATREAVVAAARRARAHEFIEAKGGYDAPVGERGLNLSGGQRQRLAIARAILRDPPILLLDEATSMIDADSEARITEALADLAGGRTTLVVAHRLSTVLAADRIVVLDAGRVADTGTHDELLERCEVYRAIARHQLAAATP